MVSPYEPLGFCPTCGYPMDAGTCPECGKRTKSPLPFDPIHPRRGDRLVNAVMLALRIGTGLGKTLIVLLVVLTLVSWAYLLLG